MYEIIDKIQNWFKVNCNGDWEHNYGYKIQTLDNPGWSIEIDLVETALENLDYQKEFQNLGNVDDWIFIRTNNKVLNIDCGPENMKLAFGIFFNEILPNYLNENFNYQVYLPIAKDDIKIWTPAKSKLVNEKSVQITEIEDVQYKNIKFQNLEKMKFDQNDIEQSIVTYSVGDIIEVELQQVYDGVILVAKETKRD